MQTEAKTDGRTRIETDEVPTLSARQQKALLRGPDRRTRLGRRDAALIALLVATGCRVGEAVRLRTEHVQRGPNNSLVLSMPTLKQRRKDGKAPLRPVVLIAPFLRAFQRYLDDALPGYWVFPGRQGEHLSISAAQRAVNSHLKSIRPDMHVHALRHTALTDILRGSGGNVWLAARQAGHSDTRMVYRTYGRYLTRDAHEAAEARSLALSQQGRKATA